MNRNYSVVSVLKVPNAHICTDTCSSTAIGIYALPNAQYWPLLLVAVLQHGPVMCHATFLTFFRPGLFPARSFVVRLRLLRPLLESLL